MPNTVEGNDQRSAQFLEYLAAPRLAVPAAFAADLARSFPGSAILLSGLANYWLLLDRHIATITIILVRYVPPGRPYGRTSVAPTRTCD
jgi:hypothetical protein